MNTRVTLQPIGCPDCGRQLSAMANGGALHLRCTNERCGIIWPADTALAKHMEKRTKEKAAVPNINIEQRPPKLDPGTVARLTRAEVESRKVTTTP